MSRTCARMMALCVMGAAGAAQADELRFQNDLGLYELEYTRCSVQSTFGNYFYTHGSVVELTAVDVALGYGQNGRGFEVYVYDDADDDGDPANATLRSVATSTIQNGRDADRRDIATQRVEIEPTQVKGGFFVLVRVLEQPFSAPSCGHGQWSTAPVAYLGHGVPRGRSWTVSPLPSDGPMGGNLPVDFENLGNNFLGSDAGPFLGTWVIRAEGRPPSDDSTQMGPDMNEDGRYDSGDFLAFLSLYAEGAADYDRSGVQNSDDFVAFLNDWSDAAR